MICTNASFHEIPLHDKELLVICARNLLNGLLSTKNHGFKGMPKRPARGISIVERCVQVVESCCKSCRQEGCVRCAIASELRAAEGRIIDEREAELAEMGLDDHDVTEILDALVDDFCERHTPFGAVLLGEWHHHRSFTVPSTSTDAAALS